ncbi:hypothetical protein [Jidongwangia harbinensis]|uniref:hypothetical protein n=1 Tax=Jidongwangia harbinensis TaxID=2878561 RepID=UPI001CD9A760|nr:hypothetical protein [Jidongwangia harbinensis]MCA2214238.1 hypothetical protein [Jidongwangia harbinensis]
MGAGGTVVRAEARRRWALVLAVVVLLGSVPAVLAAWPVRAARIDAGVLRERIAASAAQPYHGFAQSTGLLGLPPLRNLEQVTALVSRTTQMRTWYAGPDRGRVDVVGGGTERDLYRTPDGQYVWDYGANQLTRVVGDQPVRLPTAADLTPPELARRLLALAAGDRVEPLAGRRVAGVAAAGLRIVPAAPGTTVAHVDVWADPASGLPLQAELTAKGGARPVFVSRFLEVTLGVPDARVLTPPAARPGMGFTVTAVPDVLGALNRWQRSAGLPDRLAGQPRRDAVDGTDAVGVYGTGLARFVVLGVPRRFGAEAYDNAEAFGRSIEMPGGRAALLATGLLTVLVVQGDRTYLAAGLVEPATLERAAADLAGAAA